MLLCSISSEGEKIKKVFGKVVSLKKVNKWEADKILNCPEILINEADGKQLIKQKGYFWPLSVVDPKNNKYSKRQMDTHLSGIQFILESNLDPKFDFFWHFPQNIAYKEFNKPVINYRYFYDHKMEFHSPEGKNRYMEGKFTTDDKKEKTFKIVF